MAPRQLERVKTLRFVAPRQFECVNTQCFCGSEAVRMCEDIVLWLRGSKLERVKTLCFVASRQLERVKTLLRSSETARMCECTVFMVPRQLARMCENIMFCGLWLRGS